MNSQRTNRGSLCRCLAVATPVTTPTNYPGQCKQSVHDFRCTIGRLGCAYLDVMVRKLLSQQQGSSQSIYETAVRRVYLPIYLKDKVLIGRGMACEEVLHEALHLSPPKHQSIKQGARRNRLEF